MSDMHEEIAAFQAWRQGEQDAGRLATSHEHSFRAGWHHRDKTITTIQAENAALQLRIKKAHYWAECEDDDCRLDGENCPGRQTWLPTAIGEQG